MVMIRQRVTSPLSADRGEPWGSRAACAGRDVNVFYGDVDDIDATAHEQVEAAKHLCGTCPVARQCLREAERRDERYGVWGGKDFSTRSASDLAARREHIRNQVAALYEQGLTDRQIAAELDISYTSVGDHRKKLELPSRYRYGQSVTA